ncbi:hypothetical protein AVEN_148600-1, partial [Araneus ventricosus]
MNLTIPRILCLETRLLATLFRHSCSKFGTGFLICQESQCQTSNKDAPVPWNYFIHHKSPDVSRMEGQHDMDTIPAASTEATPTRQSVVCNSHKIGRET